ncbi:DUF2214 domain-containing protein [Roseomonas sp. E05]|uniref:DUF6644 family protein n=1 Tax=Roseomonas sp. E05 TaxID=3046310 RepID=UPI0024BB1065|nr:DUF6644 family protein [Roseomonas sp. E05]MDJ0389105.1 DUF2214 domain-containing protein [Roseomonas sp. E05]
MEGWLQLLSDWPVAVALRRSAVLYPLVNAAHILSFGVVLGAIVTLDLRLLGLFRRHALAALGPPLSCVAGMALAGAALTGFLLFSTRPAAYVENPAFLAKLALVALGLLNALALRAGRSWRTALEGGPVPNRVRLAALVSLLVWPGAVLAGRWIGFLQ